MPLEVIHISFDDNSMTLKMPVAKAAAQGLRNFEEDTLGPARIADFRSLERSSNSRAIAQIAKLSRQLLECLGRHQKVDLQLQSRRTNSSNGDRMAKIRDRAAKSKTL